MKKILIWALVFAWIYQTMPLPVRAQETTPKPKPYVVVMDFEAEGEISKALGRTVSDKVRETLLSTKKYIVIDRSNIEIIVEELKLGQSGLCDQSCAVQLGRALSAHFIITGRVVMLGPQECRVTGQLTDVARTDIVRSESENCTCDGKEILAAAETVALKLAGVKATRATLVIQTTPKSAKAYIDGEEKGKTPISVKVKPGRHKVMVAARGYEMQERAITAAPGETMPMRFSLKKEKKKWYNTWWFYTVCGVVVAGGVAAAVAGASDSGSGTSSDDGGGDKTGSVSLTW